VILIGCGWPTVAPAPRDGLSAQQAEAYRALAHALSGYMNARASDVELDLALAGTVEDLLLHARAFEDADWQKGRAAFEMELGAAKVPQETAIDVWLDIDAPWRERWAQGEQRSGEPALDELLDTFEMRVVKLGAFAGGVFRLIAPRELNGFALENRIAEVPGIGGLIAGWDPYSWGNSFHVGYGAQVRPAVRRGGFCLRFGLGWGDCLAGCIHGRSYDFEIDGDGATRLVQVAGAPLPDNIFAY
jgi:hypothetical protein